MVANVEEGGLKPALDSYLFQGPGRELAAYFSVEGVHHQHPRHYTGKQLPAQCNGKEPLLSEGAY